MVWVPRRPRGEPLKILLCQPVPFRVRHRAEQNEDILTRVGIEAVVDSRMPKRPSIIVVLVAWPELGVTYGV